MGCLALLTEAGPGKYKPSPAPLGSPGARRSQGHPLLLLLSEEKLNLPSQLLLLPLCPSVSPGQPLGLGVIPAAGAPPLWSVTLTTHFKRARRTGAQQKGAWQACGWRGRSESALDSPGPWAMLPERLRTETLHHLSHGGREGLSTSTLSPNRYSTQRLGGEESPSHPFL